MIYPLVLGIVAIVVAIVGFRLIMAVERIASYFMVANLVFLTIAIFVVLDMPALFEVGALVPAAFVAQIAAAASYQIALAPMVSDMTRYLPTRIGTKATATSSLRWLLAMNDYDIDGELDYQTWDDEWGVKQFGPWLDT